MKKVILVPDSFKGTLTSQEICEIMEACIHRHFPNTEVVSIPVADGGEGSVDCFLQALGGQKFEATVHGVFGEPIKGFYGLLPDGKTAVIEMACCAGLPLAEGRLNPALASSYGVGELMLEAARQGATRIILGLGGSASNDAGCGAAAAVGVRFMNAEGNTFVPTGGSLKEIVHIDTSTLHTQLKDIELIAMCDIDNPMYGTNGAAYVFAPQKGADAAMVEQLDAGLRHLNTVFEQDLQMDLSELPGGGAAGAMGAGMKAFLGASLQMGIQTVLDTVNFEEQLVDATLVFTGEGKLDRQSLRGKVVLGVARHARVLKIPVVAVVGSIGSSIASVYEEGISAIFSINTKAMDYRESRHFARENLSITMDNIMRFITALRQE